MNLFEEKSQDELKAEWHKKRSMGIGGSDIGVVMGDSPYKTRYQLWLEKTKRIQAEDISGKFHVQRGVMNEPVARAKFEEMSQMRFEPRSWVIDGKEYLRCNDDGWNDQFKAMLEIKTMGARPHADVANGIVPPHYLQQLQYNMGIAKANIGYFISYRPEDGTLYAVTVHPDLALQEKLMQAAEKFWLDHVIGDTPPELTDGDYQNCLDPDFEDASERYKQIKAQIKLLEEEMEEVETRLQGFLGNAGAIRQNGLLIQRIVRKGNVEYTKIPELQGVDLEKYRKPSTTYIAIKGER
jgi:putative phage-type endonuclease